MAHENTEKSMVKVRKPRLGTHLEGMGMGEGGGGAAQTDPTVDVEGPRCKQRKGL